MNERLRYASVVLLLGGTIGLVAGCESTPKKTTKTSSTTMSEPYVGERTTTVQDTRPGEARSRPAVTSRSWAGYTPATMSQMNVTELAYPTGDKDTSAILLHQVMPVEVMRGGEYTYEYHLTNLTEMTHQNVVLTSEHHNNMRLVSSTPEAVASVTGYQWFVGDLMSHETRIIKIRATSNDIGPASNCIAVAYENVMCAQTTVVEPDLMLIKTASSDGTVCEDFELHYEVFNPGSGRAGNVVIRDELPSGLRLKDGRGIVQITVGDLMPGERKAFTVPAKGVETGSHRSIAVAKGDGGLISESENIQTIIYEPVLALTAESEEREFVGRNLDLVFNVRNNGDTDAESTSVVANLPSGVTVDEISNNGTSGNNAVTWQLGRIAPGDMKSVRMSVKPMATGTVRVNATATAVCAEAVSVDTSTSVLGIPAILLECVDTGDPSELGDVVTYIITATNQGSATGRNITITCEFPTQQSYVSSDGPTTGAVRGQTINFRPLPTLAPQAQAQWKITLKSEAVGDIRFRVQMTEDQLGDEPVRETEATTLYD